MAIYPWMVGTQPLDEHAQLQAAARRLAQAHRQLGRARPRDSAALAKIEHAYTVVVRRRDYLAARLGLPEEG